MTTVERHERFAIKSKIVPYPDNIMAVWIVLAILYKKA